MDERSKVRPGVISYLAGRLSVSADDLEMVLNTRKGPTSCYRQHRVRKRDGSCRILCIPTEPLMTIQKAINRHVLSRATPSPIAHGCVKGRSIVTAAAEHLHAHSLIELDIQDAFGSADVFGQFLRPSKIERYLSELGIRNKEMLEVLLRLVTYRTGRFRRLCLPQGAPTSPAMYNLYRRSLDHALHEYAQSIDATVTVYVDNYFFSMKSESIRTQIHRRLENKIIDHGFSINKEKKRYITDGNRGGQPLRILGLNVIDGDIYLPPTTIRRYRGLLYQAGMNSDWETYAWIKGIAIQVYAGWPSQLKLIWQRGRERASRVDFPSMEEYYRTEEDLFDGL